MRWIKLALVLFCLGLTNCATHKVTPLLLTDLINYNSTVIELYTVCSDGANYAPENEGCDPEILESKIKELMSFSKIFISADIKQPHGYDVYLETVMIFFRIGERNGDEYSQAELIARQFFETQKAYSGKSIDIARYHWAVVGAAHASWQWNYDRFSLGAERKTVLLICLAEGRRSQYSLDGPRIIRLIQSLEVLEAITSTMQ